MGVILTREQKRMVVFGRSRTSVFVTRQRKALVIGGGRQGPAGAGDKNYVHTQVLPSTTWTINHNLGKYPAVTFRDSGGSNIMMGYQHISVNQVVATANSSVSGSAECN